MESHTTQKIPYPVDDKRIINGWAFFDWANSAFALVITTAIFPGYLEGVLYDEFDFLGIRMKDSAILGFSISVAYIIISLFLPLLTGIADYGRRKMPFMKFFTRLGGLACFSLFFFVSQDTMWIGLLGFILGVIGFAGGQVFYNSYLPDIVSEEKYDSVSAKGFAYGYIGSVLLLVFNLMMLLNPTWFGLDQLIGEDTIWGNNAEALAARISFIMVGLWWIGFSQITFNRLPVEKGLPLSKDILSKGYEELRKVYNQLKTLTQTKRFLLAFFSYSAGAQTAIFLASIFAIKELGFETAELIRVVLILQLVGIGGAYLFAKLSGIYGNKKILILILLIWTSIVIVGYFLEGKTAFYVLAAFVGLVMGGVQSLSRSTYSKLIPRDTKDTASFFSSLMCWRRWRLLLGP